MERFFNTTGPCNPTDHYMLPPAARLVGAQLDRYIKNKLYWVLHAPRQTGKTTFLRSWMLEINASGEALACYVTVERCQGVPEPERAMPAICNAIQAAAKESLGERYAPPMPLAEPLSMLDAILRAWAELAAPKPLVVLFDEVDVLQDQTMVSFLCQLRGGFPGRGVGVFPVSVALVGMRDLRDYLIRSKDGEPVNPGSPFNVKEDSAGIANFSRQDVFALARQRTAEVGQKFSDAALDMIFDQTQGQPWLTNAILLKCIWTLCANNEPVDVAQVHQARELLIQERAVHLDSLAERLRDPRIKRIVQSIILGSIDPELTAGDDWLLASDLGLVTKQDGTPQIANAIYREVIARVLSQGMQDAIPTPEFRWQKADGSLDMDALLREFQVFWRRHSETWEAKADYREAFPHLLVMAFLQRVVNGGGRIEREYAAGRGRVDLAVWYAERWTIIETKLVHPGDGREATIAEGLQQIERYRSLIDPTAEAYLVVFDRTVAGRATAWDKRLTWETRAGAGGPSAGGGGGGNAASSAGAASSGSVTVVGG